MMTVPHAREILLVTPEPSPPPGDDARWDELRAVLHRALVRLAPRLSEAERDDLAQEGLVRLVRGGREVNNSYVWKVAWSVLQDRRRRRHRRPEHGEDGLRTASDDQPGPERLAESAELRGFLQECLAAAPASRRDFLTLYLLGHSPAECAERLDATRKKAENAIYRGLAALRECLASKGVTR